MHWTFALVLEPVCMALMLYGALCDDVLVFRVAGVVAFFSLVGPMMAEGMLQKKWRKRQRDCVLRKHSEPPRYLEEM